ncbi:MAG: hypothetical protein D6798_01590 [Deltaproteobacteria bacterium]|nr:MAG: hypothetical protein D6798_01590 [Deltaproteobacteria bacterium]
MARITLTLAPEFGGTCFGPFPAGNIALGSDVEHCHIALSTALGLDPVHAWVTLQEDGACWLQPTRVGTGLFLYRAAGGGAQPVSGAVPLRPGDSFALGQPHGPRFIVAEAAEPVAAPGGRRGRLPPRGGRGVPTADAMADEVKRQISSTAMTWGPFAQLSQVFYRFRSGALMQPRYLVGAVIALMGMVATGCAGLVAALRHVL